MGQFGGQWLGGDHIAAGWQHLAAERVIQVVHIGVAAQHQGLGADMALRRVHLHLGAVVDTGDR
ncbi:hypothetical protein D3C85_1389610 [compost metagenome]